MSRPFAQWCILLGVVLLVVGCSDGGKQSASTGSPAPSLDSSDAKQRAEAAREAAKKYGAEP